MKIDIGNYRITSDERQFIIQSVGYVTESKVTKEENIGKEKTKNLAYYVSFKNALKYLANKIILDNDDTKIILDKLNELERKIDDMDYIPNGIYESFNQDDQRLIKNSLSEVALERYMDEHHLKEDVNQEMEDKALKELKEAERIMHLLKVLSGKEKYVKEK
ncbi:MULTISPECIES: hypothetical protein [Clostridium]|uniref:hypothetical protein n=1 Tax=Clostridium TaxID=1485 RepID=UPI00016BD1D2|nr:MULTISPECIES: hypothetical protein [Clostridium]EDT26169.1 hypothetical protein AC5_1722 [Clostridium perfringens CPE str. F4969]EGT0682005.1 hypothetical protein [Clostridium perfringens]EGT4144727.1 hypothetical protein [Clostridium perfringens]MDH5064957.1 hypothetical protein [Clostridium perfringens]MDK0681375.1 hypothetical protein [Clostridium perfringens]